MTFLSSLGTALKAAGELLSPSAPAATVIATVRGSQVTVGVVRKEIVNIEAIWPLIKKAVASKFALADDAALADGLLQIGVDSGEPDVSRISGLSQDTVDTLVFIAGHIDIAATEGTVLKPVDPWPASRTK